MLRLLIYILFAAIALYAISEIPSALLQGLS